MMALVDDKASGKPLYRNTVRAYVRMLWKGDIDREMFEDNMTIAIERMFTQAWHEGAREMGILPTELTEGEKNALMKLIDDELQYLPQFSDAIEAGSRANRGKLTPLLRRSDLWVNKYDKVFNQAKAMAGRDQKLMWVRGMTKQPCRDALKLNGRVYRASTWAKHNILPQSIDLECRGFNCQCKLVATNEPITRGRPPKLTYQLNNQPRDLQYGNWRPQET